MCVYFHYILYGSLSTIKSIIHLSRNMSKFLKHLLRKPWYHWVTSSISWDLEENVILESMKYQTMYSMYFMITWLVYVIPNLANTIDIFYVAIPISDNLYKWLFTMDVKQIKLSNYLFMIFWGCQGGISLKDMHVRGWESASRNEWKPQCL